jgi:hypothetical protein
MQAPTNNPAEPPDKSGDEEKIGLMALISTVFAAGLGVQSSKNRERDFQQGRAGVFIAAGIIATLLFIGSIFLIVQLVLKGTGN